jgi:5-methylcytosine-specific restriction endonuclease McrA
MSSLRLVGGTVDDLRENATLRAPKRWANHPQRVVVARYEQYLSSPRWARRKAAYFKTRAPKCKACKSWEQVDLHHLTYANLGHERDGDLMALCRTCHEAVHELHAQNPNASLAKITKRFAKQRRSVEKAG